MLHVTLHLMLHLLHVYMLHGQILNSVKVWLNPSNFTFKMTNCLISPKFNTNNVSGWKFRSIETRYYNSLMLDVIILVIKFLFI